MESFILDVINIQTYRNFTFPLQLLESGDHLSDVRTLKKRVRSELEEIRSTIFECNLEGKTRFNYIIFLLARNSH